MKQLFRLGILGLLWLGLSYGAAAEAPAPVDVSAVIAQLQTQGDAAIVAYRPDAGLETADTFSSLYFDLFEGSGLEVAVGLRDPQLKSKLESQFGGVIGAVSRGLPATEVNAAWQTLRGSLQATATAWSENHAEGFWSLALQSFLILLREGFEAILVIGALVAYLRRQGAVAQLPAIYTGVALALVASLFTAWLMQSVLHIAGGAAQEAMEGLTMLIAAAVLFYVSYWLISKAEAARWQAWIKGQINNAVSRGSLTALALAAFLAVYREGAETVLFYQALEAQAQNQQLPLLIGLIGAAAALLGMFWVMRSASLKLPMGLFFGVTAGLLYYLAVSFAGNGVLELQSAGWVGITPLAWIPQVAWLGLHPSLETVAAQLLLLAPLPFALLWWLRQRAAVSQ